MRIPKMC